MRSRKGYWLAVFAIFAIVSGIWIRSGGLIAASFPLLVYVTLTSLLSRSEEFDIELERSLDDTRIMAGEEVGVTLTIRNRGDTLEFLELEDVLPEFVTVSGTGGRSSDGQTAGGGTSDGQDVVGGSSDGQDAVGGSSDGQTAVGSNRALVSLEKGEELTLRYSLQCPFRGRYRLDRVRLRYQDHAGFHIRKIDKKLRSEFSVVSKIEPARGLKIAPRKTRNWIGMIKSRRIGTGAEFYGMRDYVAGDELRKINWKATARRDEIITNEFESERSGDVTIILDARKESNVGTMENNTVEHGIRATSTIASHILREKNRVGLIVLRDIIDEVHPAFGKRQFYRISETLMDVKAGGELPFDDARWMVTSHFPLESQIIVMSPLLDYKIVESIADLCARGYDLVVVSPSPMEIEGLILEPDRELEIAKRIQALERENLISDLRKYARIVDWDSGQPIATALRGVERLQVRF